MQHSSNYQWISIIASHLVSPRPCCFVSWLSKSCLFMFSWFVLLLSFFSPSFFFYFFISEGFEVLCLYVLSCRFKSVSVILPFAPPQHRCTQPTASSQTFMSQRCNTAIQTDAFGAVIAHLLDATSRRGPLEDLLFQNRAWDWALETLRLQSFLCVFKAIQTPIFWGKPFASW